jgi:hypothetical protein
MSRASEAIARLEHFAAEALDPDVRAVAQAAGEALAAQEAELDRLRQRVDELETTAQPRKGE